MQPMMKILLILLLGLASARATSSTTTTTTTSTTTTTTATTTTVTTTTTTGTTTTTTATTTTGTTTTTQAKLPPSPFGCAYANNTLGDCGCNGEIFIAHQCHSGFICLGGGDDPFINTATGVWQGCQIECAEDEVLRADPNNGGQWDCFRTSEGSRPLTCAGKFKTECGCLPEIPEDPADEPTECKIGDCECDNQIWVAHHCHEAKVCNAGGFSMVDCKGTTMTLPNGTEVATDYVNVNLLTHTWSCVQTDELCLGSFHVGCQADEPAEPDSGSPCLPSSLLLLAILPLTSLTYSLLSI